MLRRSILAMAMAIVACSKPETPAPATAPPPSILLVTLDTTRFDSVGPEAKGVSTPSFNALAARSRRFMQAYAAAPQTLPSHTSMLTGMYPAGHGIHENARQLAPTHPLISERLRERGYHTAAFVSAFPLAKRFGLARGFEVYDDADPKNERAARETTDRALAWLGAQSAEPLFLWVHYFEPHYPYEPSYLGEIATMDAQLGRLLTAFAQRPNGAVIVAADHGEGLGEHGEAQHGNLLYQGVMHVPLLIAGPGAPAGVVDTPVSTRRIFHTILDWAGAGAEHSLRGAGTEVVAGEAMVPFLQFGWQPQVMAVDGRQKTIHAGQLEVYDVVADPAETRDLGASATLSREVRKTLQEYPLPSMLPPTSETLTAEEQRQLASLGYITSATKPVVRKDAPRPRDMVHLFDDLDRASVLFTREQYAAVIPIFEKILASDPRNLMAALRLAAAHSALGHDDAALAAFRRAEAIAPQSEDVRVYLALHYAKTREWERAVPMLEQIVAASPERLPPLEALATVRERQGRLPEALALRQRIAGLKTLSQAELVHLGRLAMENGQTAAAIDALERAKAGTDLELGVLYLASNRLPEARDALDRVPPTHPEYPLALFKRAQVSVLLNEPDRAERIAKARAGANATTRALIDRERLFR
ncbi:MAG TPA: sulfatase-like hydrolase/transferase [Thermoanaerobaculia bacterium]|jgi:tetratricopeptide (TPR) repeat protein